MTVVGRISWMILVISKSIFKPEVLRSEWLGNVWVVLAYYELLYLHRIHRLKFLKSMRFETYKESLGREMVKSFKFLYDVAVILSRAKSG